MREKLIELVNNVLKHLPWGEVSSHTAGDVADHLIANGVTIQKWIPVSERLPEEFQRVLICGAYKFLAVGRVMNGRWVISWNNDEAKSVTHWMPLPEPPKGD
jgi:hypothetical protein